MPWQSSQVWHRGLGLPPEGMLVAVLMANARRGAVIGRYGHPCRRRPFLSW
jgi:hypothetical protein